MRVVLLVITLFLLYPETVQAKKKKKHTYTTNDIILNSDSLLRSKLGDSLFQFCKMESGSYYTSGKGKKTVFKNFTTVEKLPKDFNKAFMRYEFLMPYCECILYDTISGLISFEVQKEDSIFSFAAEPDAGFIPEMAIAHTPCNFLSEKDAIGIALGDTLIRGINPPYATLAYVPARKVFTWFIFSLTWNERDFDNNKESLKDVVQINAETGEILQHKTYPYTADIEDITLSK